MAALHFATAQAVPALMITGAAFLVAGLCVAITEVLKVVPNQSKKIDDVLEFEKSQVPTYNILAAIETTARQFSARALDTGHIGPSNDVNKRHKKKHTKVDLNKTIELMEDKEEKEHHKKRH